MPQQKLSAARPYKTERVLGAHRLAQYIARNRCQRYLRLALFPSEANRLKERYGVGFETLSPLLSAEGQSFERSKLDELIAQGERVNDLTNKSGAEFLEELKAQKQGRIYYYQPGLEGSIGGWPCGGRADLIEVTRLPDGSFDCLVIDIKASPRETVGYRLQVAFYAVLLAELMRDNGLQVAAMRGTIAARDSEFAPDKWNIFDLALFVDEIERLIGAPDSDVARAVQADFSNASYHLGGHCDGCPYNSLCFVDTAEREDLSLVPHMTTTEKRALHAEGISSVRELARLMKYAGRGVETAEGYEEEVARIGSRWPLNSRLPVLTQRARAALARHDKTTEHRRALYGTSWGSLPDISNYPDLVKVFVDAQRDHLQDRLYLLSALVVGPKGSFKIVEMADAPPDTEAEQSLLIRWMQAVLPTIGRAADSSDAPVHVYLYDRRGQRSLLDALARHFAALCAIPAFYDLLTSTPALTQSMISFLGDEVCERQNLGAICNNLYEVAASLGFKWRDADVNVPRQFRTRIFDNRRPYVRDQENLLFSVPEEKAGSDALWVESASRFGTEIPLEYAYVAWGLLSDSEGLKGETRAQIRGFIGTSTEDIKALAEARLEALRHIEESFRYKNRQVEKQPLALDRIDQVEVEPETVPLHRALEDFLRLEHYASLQERLLHFALPPELRAETGRTAILRCVSYDKEERLATLTVTDDSGNASVAGDTGMLRLREGDWLTLNPLLDEETGQPLTGKRIVHGRLCVVEEIRETQVRLRLMAMSFKNSKFRFGHRMIEPEQGQIYTLDEMADDLNADKFFEACSNASSNHLYQWIENPAQGRAARTWIRPTRLRSALQITALAHAAQMPNGLTLAQREVIGSFIKDRVLVLQGPPGTGKSHTLGFAAIARALALYTPMRPFRVLVCAKTHAAVEIALASIRARADRLLAELNPHAQGEQDFDKLLAPLTHLKVCKIVNDLSEHLPKGVEPLSADGDKRVKAPEQWARLAAEPLLVIGGTPGGLYNLIKRGPAKGKTIDWASKYFDLALVDEASQMGIAETLMAAAFLREDGQFIAIGDHRQMPPILAHAWDQESRRDLERIKPHLSIFEYLRELGFASAALDESFRIPEEVANFLGRHVYAADGVRFHSRNRKRLEVNSDLSDAPDWVKAALSPEHPLIVIEHSEVGSQQVNEFEASLIKELTRVASECIDLNASDGLGVVVPHRAQKFLLRERLPAYADSIDTVERFQGGERDLIIVSATVSDREFAAAESDFLLDPRRFTVAVSRPKRKVIVVASRAVFDLVPADLDDYERGSLWKHLRHEAEMGVLWQGKIEACDVSVRTISTGSDNS
jgi:AAA domain/PD-(D/E)XK nuclease superfamily